MNLGTRQLTAFLHLSCSVQAFRFWSRILILTFLDNEPIRLNKPLPPEIVFGFGVYYSNRKNQEGQVEGSVVIPLQEYASKESDFEDEKI